VKKVSILFLCMLMFAQVVSAEEPKSIWITSACYQLKLTANDKLSVKKNYVATYLVTSSKGETYIAKKLATSSDRHSGDVVFPDDFKNKKTNLQAYADCFEGDRYNWQIFVDDDLKDSGFLEFKREKLNSK